jgi:selenocysteine lyase/cysteine desulfurase
MKTPSDSVGPLVVLQSNDAEGLVRLLAEKNVVCSSRHDGLRLSFHAYNTLEDVKVILRFLEEHVSRFVTAEGMKSAQR